MADAMRLLPGWLAETFSLRPPSGLRIGEVAHSGGVRLELLGALADELAARRDSELGEHVAQVVIDGAPAEEEPGSDLPVGRALGNEAGDLHLLRRQTIERAGRPGS